MEHVYIECECSSCEHTVRLSYFPDDKDVLYMEVHLKSSPLFTRIRQALRHIFGHRCEYGEFGEFVWNKDQVGRLKSACEEFLKG